MHISGSYAPNKTIPLKQHLSIHLLYLPFILFLAAASFPQA